MYGCCWKTFSEQGNKKGTDGLPSDPETQSVLIHVTERMIKSQNMYYKKKKKTGINTN